jgi:hypothetical protein
MCFFHACDIVQRIIRNNYLLKICLVVINKDLIWVAQGALHTLMNLNVNHVKLRPLSVKKAQEGVLG